MEASRPVPERSVTAAAPQAVPLEPTGVVQPDGAPPPAASRAGAPRDEAPRDGAPNGAGVGVGVGEEVRATSFLERATLRRRLRYLRRRRELALRELGELVLESHSRGERSPELGAKLTSAERMASESERLERALEERTERLVLREPGIAVCGSCAELHGSEDRFCPHCGTPARKS
jgi:hypothetical protein